MADDPDRGAPARDRSSEEALAPTEAAPIRPAEPIPLATVDRILYAVGDEIARGGLGRILEATDLRLARTVAIKELLREGPEYRARFAREALLTARLQHPAIVPVYEAGLWPDGAPFFAMKLVAGKSLEAAVRERETLEERLGLLPHVIDAVEALAYAHGRGIIHRDLKPANVLVGDFGETVVIDWGLAKDFHSADEPLPRGSGPRASGSGGATEEGSVLGTPAYMPPEQALGQPVDERADVYALGALLYHVIAGGPPYTGTSSEQILARVVREAPEELADKEPGVPADLVTIVRKALARDPEGRYPTAAELAEDLIRYQRGQRVAAHRYSARTLVWRWARRHRGAVLVATAMLAVLLLVVGFDVRRIVAERDRAEAERVQAERLREQADARGDALALREAEALLGRDPRRALAWLKHLAPDSRAYGAARTIAADALTRGVPRHVYADAPAQALVFAPDGRLLAEARGADVLVLDVTAGQSLTLRGRGGPARALAFSPRGGRLAFAGADGTVHVWDRSVRAQADLPGHDGEVTALAFAGEDLLATVGRDGTLRLWGLGTGAPPRVLRAHAGAVLDVAAAPGLVATAGADRVVRLWDAAGLPVAALPHPAVPTQVLLAPDGAWLATIADDHKVRLYTGATRQGGVVDSHRSAVLAAAYGAGGLLATADESGEIHLLDVERRQVERLAGHDDAVLALAWDPTGTELVSGGRDHTIRIWDPRSGRARTLRGHDGDVTALAHGPGGLLASSARDRTVRLWDLAAGQPRVLGPGAGLVALAAPTDGQRCAAGGAAELRTWDVAAGPGRLVEGVTGTRALAYSPDGAELAVGGDDGAVRLFDADGGHGRALARLDGPVTALAFDLRGRRLAAAGAAGLRVLDVTAGTALLSDDAPVAGLAFSPGGSLLATAGADVRLWEMDRLRARVLEGAAGPFAAVVVSPDGHHVVAGGAAGVAMWSIGSGAETDLGGEPVDRLAFSQDGKTLVGTGADRALRVWDVASGAARVFPSEAGGAITALAVRGQTAATAGADGAVRLWDVGSGHSRLLGGHSGPVTAVAFVAGGRTLATTGADGTVRLWPDDLPEDRGALRTFLATATDAQVGEEL